MQHITDLDLLNPLRAFVDYDPHPMVIDRSLSDHITSTTFEFGSIPKRERIDSEDFLLTFSNRESREVELFTVDSNGNRMCVAEEPRPRRKSSIVLIPDPTLLELEVD